MFLKFLLVPLLVVLLFCGRLFADEKVVVAVIDGPMDVHHPSLAKGIDVDFLKNTKLVDQSGWIWSLYDLNKSSQTYNESLFGAERLSAILRHLRFGDYVDDYNKQPANGRNVGNSLNNFLMTIEHAFRWRYSKVLRSDYDLYRGQLSHATSVAGAVLRESTNVCLVPIPVLSIFTGRTVTNIASPQVFDEGALRAVAKEFVNVQTAFIRASGARIVVMSYGSSEDLYNVPGVVQNAKAIATIEREKWELLFTQNPNVVFVAAAGNDGLDIAERHKAGLVSTESVKAPNLVRVASIGSTGRISKFSNYSQEFVDVAAEGERLLLPHYGGRSDVASGTSLSAPLVAGKLSRIFSKSPHYSVEQAIAELYVNHTHSDFFLNNYVKHGRKLLPCVAALTRL